MHFFHLFEKICHIQWFGTPVIENFYFLLLVKQDMFTYYQKEMTCELTVLCRKLFCGGRHQRNCEN